jgi:uncharacterized protein DUF6632
MKATPPPQSPTEQMRDCSVAIPTSEGSACAFFTKRWGTAMNDSTREKLLKAALVVFGVIFFLIYPLGLVWPSGWLWHGGGGKYYLQMICGIYAVLGAFLINAARNPSEHRSLIWFTIWSSIVHALIMAGQAISDGHEAGHLVGDVPALLLVAVVLWLLLPSKPTPAVAA